MPARQSRKIPSLARGFIESMARIFVGEPVRIVRKSTYERLQRLAYRGLLRSAEESGNMEFIESEIRRNQLTQADLDRLARHHTPIEEWPDSDEELLHPSAFAEGPASEEDAPSDREGHTVSS